MNNTSGVKQAPQISTISKTEYYRRRRIGQVSPLAPLKLNQQLDLYRSQPLKQPNLDSGSINNQTSSTRPGQKRVSSSHNTRQEQEKKNNFFEAD